MLRLPLFLTSYYKHLVRTIYYITTYRLAIHNTIGLLHATENRQQRSCRRDVVTGGHAVFFAINSSAASAEIDNSFIPLVYLDLLVLMYR
jgi:hypothetical protein